MEEYPLRVRNNILPLSISGKLPQAFDEWYFTDNTIDHGHATETCQLCEQEDLRYHFEIANKLTNNKLLVGSQCILKFDLPVFEHGRRLTNHGAKKKLEQLMQKMHFESCMGALKELNDIEENPILSTAISYYRKNKYLSPRLAFVVMWRLSVHKIAYNPSFFKINLSLKKHKSDLMEMPLSQVHKIWHSLNSSQRKIALRLGHRAPE
ncbi:hypothetical protein ACSZNX_02455 [Aeromonas veronii]|uniref:hypothetical protein n=1 Tax=Aeromonas veronii TaxID=654 RepID=UPI0038E73678